RPTRSSKLPRRRLRRPDAPPRDRESGAVLLRAPLRPLLHAGEDLQELVLLDRLLLEEDRRELVELRPVELEDLQGLVVRVVDHAPDLRVDLERDLIGVVRMRREVAPEEDLALLRS